MGTFFANITVVGQNQDTLVQYLEKINKNAYVSPTVNNCTVVYDEESDYDTEKLSSLAIQISTNFNCPTFAILIHDDSVFHYELYKDGQLLDEYISNPPTENSTSISFPEGGDAETLCNVLGAKQAINQIRPILREPGNDGMYFFASERHKKLVKKLGLPDFWSTNCVGGYRYIEEEYDDIISRTPEQLLSLLKKTFLANN